MKKFLAYTAAIVLGFFVLGPIGSIVGVILVWLMRKQS
jgi:uncharacterized Tic20 family protein